MSNQFSIVRKKDSFQWKVLWPFLGGIACGWYGLMQIIDYLKGTSEEIIGVIISSFIGAILLAFAVWQFISYFKTGKQLVQFTDTAVIFPNARIPLKSILKISVDWDRVTVTKKTRRVLSFDLSSYTSGISPQELSLIESWVKEHGISIYYGPNDQKIEMKDLEAEIENAKPKKQFAATALTSKSEKHLSKKANPYTGNKGDKTPAKVWLMVIWAGLAILGFFIVVFGIPREIRLIYYFKLTNTSSNNNLNNIKPGSHIKINGTVFSHNPFLAVWDKRPVVYEHQIYIKRYSRSIIERTTIHKSVSFQLITRSGIIIWVEPSVKPGNQDIYELKITGEDKHYTDWTISSGEPLIVYGPVQKEAGRWVMKGRSGRRLVMTNLPEQDLNPIHHFEFWVYIFSWLFFVSGIFSLGVAIIRYNYPSNLKH